MKEIRLGVGTSPGDSAQVKPRYNITMGGPSDSANSTFSSYLSKTFNDDDNSEEEVSDHILRKRIKIGGKYSLNDTLESIDEGALQVAADFAKGIPGLDQIVGNTELLMQSAQAKEALTGLNSIVKSLAVSTGADAFSILSTDADFQQLLSLFHQASPEEKDTLRSGVEKIIDVIKNMIITAAMTFDTLIAIPAFAGGPTGVLAEILANVSTTAGTLLRGVPVERFVFKTLAERDGIVPKFIDVVSQLMTAGGIVGKIFGGIVGIASNKGGEIIKMFFSEPQELLRRLGDLYRVASGYEDEDITKQIARNAFGVQQPGMQAPIGDISNLQPMSENKYSILFLLESVDASEGDSCSECGASIYEGEKHTCEHLKEEEFKEIDLDEFSSVGGGSLGSVPVPPLSAPNRGKYKKAKKAIKEQRERISRLQAYHQKTTNKFK